MQKVWFVTLLVLFGCAFSQLTAKGNDAAFNQLWQRGNAYYQSKQFDSAAAVYEKLAEGRPQNAEIYFNLGNAYYRLNQLAPAILNYERALKADPDNKAVHDNLLLAQGRIANRVAETGDIFFVRWWKALTSQKLAGTWAVLALLLFISLLAVLLAKRWKKLPASFPGQVTGFIGVFCALSVLFAYFSAKEKAATDRAVIMVADTPLFDNPGITKTKVLIPEGTVVKIQGQRSGWNEIDLPDGRTGWVDKNAVEKI